MERFYGFDLGDAESAISKLSGSEQLIPDIIPVHDSPSFITACAFLSDGTLLIGENACYSPDAVRRKLRFKSRFLTDASSEADIRSFAAGVLSELYMSGELVKGDDVCFYIGCPAGWDKQARERYRSIFERVGYPPVRIISESRAALVSACQSRHLQIGHDILSKPVLVVDIGSSTTDFAYICQGREVGMQTAGEVTLGGGIMDELLLAEAVNHSENAAEISSIFQKSESWRTYCEFAARRLKEKYFSDMDYWVDHPCTETVLIRYDRPVRLTLRIDAEIADRLVSSPAERLGGRSFREVFHEALLDVRGGISGQQPELLFLTGGVSKLPWIRDWCLEVFPDAVMIAGNEPEFSVARGLAYSGRIDDDLRAFRSELDTLLASSTVEKIVAAHIDGLYRKAVDALVDPLLEHAAIPVFERWKDGSISRLSDTDQEMQKEIAAYLRSDEVRELLVKPISSWLRSIADELEEYTLPICVRHHVPYTALSLNSYLSATDIEISLDARDMFAVKEITLMIDSIISLLVGLVCGGTGMAVIASGPDGLIAGVLLSLLVLILGKRKMESAIMNVRLPKAVRHLVPKHSIRTRVAALSGEVREKLYRSLEEDKNEEITDRMVADLSGQIEACLTRMAEIVEIPLT
ncbi:MAG: hypothetical protein Q4B09_08355 [Lachnospiraceae bacterium]|nr:hypothetical protein [Lachnospiraceae bacterium]